MKINVFALPVLALVITAAFIALIPIPVKDAPDWIARISVILTVILGVFIAARLILRGKKRLFRWYEDYRIVVILALFGVLTFMTYLLYLSAVVIPEKTYLSDSSSAGIFTALISFMFFVIVRLSLHAYYYGKTSIMGGLQLELRESRKTIMPFVLSLTCAALPSLYYLAQNYGVHGSFYIAQVVMMTLLLSIWTYYSPLLKDLFAFK